jgi:hypothetical protein
MGTASEKPSMAFINEHRKAELPWTYEVTKCAGGQATMDLGTAFANFFRDPRKPRKQRKFRYPKFKKKRLNESFTGSVIGDVNSRRGQIQGRDMRGNANVIIAIIALANMFGYVNTLRSMSQGRAAFTMQFDRYAQIPPLPEDDPPFRPAIGMRA